MIDPADITISSDTWSSLTGDAVSLVFTDDEDTDGHTKRQDTGESSHTT